MRFLKAIVLIALTCTLIAILLKYTALYKNDVTSGEWALADESHFINPILVKNNGRISKKSYLHYVDGLSTKEVDEIVSNFSIKGCQYLSSKDKRSFLWCDSEVRTKRPVSNRVRACAEMTFQRDTGKRVALASFPGSGSTWSRTLLEQATGVYTGAIYCDRSLKGEGFLGEYITSGSVIAIKTHSRHGPKGLYEAAIFMARNIFDAVKSEINRRSTSRNHTGVITEGQYDKNDPNWIDLIQTYTSRYKRMIPAWLNQSTTDHKIPTIVIRYEDMIKDTRTQLRRMLNFLQYPYTEERLDCVMNHQIQTFHRKHDHDFNPFTNDQRKKFLSVMKHVEPLFNLYNISYRDIIDAHA